MDGGEQQEDDEEENEIRKILKSLPKVHTTDAVASSLPPLDISRTLVEECVSNCSIGEHASFADSVVIFGESR